MPENHTKGEAKRIMTERFAINGSHNVYLSPNNDCSVAAPPKVMSGWRVVYLICVTECLLCGIFIGGALWEWYGPHVKAWFVGGPGAGAAGAGTGTDKETDEPLVASALLP